MIGVGPPERRLWIGMKGLDKRAGLFSSHHTSDYGTVCKKAAPD